MVQPHGQTSKSTPPASKPKTDDQELEPAGASFVVDPNVARAIDAGYDHPVPKGQTADPNRYTIHVPSDETVFSLGKGADGPDHIKDDGITGRTKKHLHFHVEKPETTVVLGQPATDSGASRWDPEKAATVVTGYTMVTEGNAWQEAAHQHALLSLEGDALVGARKEGVAALFSNAGKTLVFGKETVSVITPTGVTIAAHSSAQANDVRVQQKTIDKWTANFLSKFGSAINTAGEVASSIASIVMGMRKAEEIGEANHSGFAKEKETSTVKMIADIGLTVSTLARAGVEFSGVELGGSVDISGEKFVGIVGGIGATMYGQLSSAIVSLGQAEVLGGVSALVKGLAWTEIASGVGTALTSLRNVEVAATFGGVEVTANTEVSVNALDGPVVLTAKTIAQMTSATSKSVVHGKTVAYLGASDGAAGYGFQALAGSGGLQLGKITANANAFASNATFDTSNSITMTDSLILAKRDDAELSLGGQVKLSKGDTFLQFTPSEAKVVCNGKILLG